MIDLFCCSNRFVLVAVAANGKQAVEMYRKHRPDIVLMDLRMPEMNGLTATIAILEESPSARIIVLATSDGEEDLHLARCVGTRGYLLKQMSRPEIEETIEAVHAGAVCFSAEAELQTHPM